MSALLNLLFIASFIAAAYLVGFERGRRYQIKRPSPRDDRKTWEREPPRGREEW